MSAVMLHEVAHALGIISSVGNASLVPSTYDPFFVNQLSLWTANLYDDLGNQAQPGQVIWCTGCVNTPSANVFDLRQDKGYFAGQHVSEVLAGAMPGAPIRILAYGQVDPDFMSHIEFKNSMMSHQAYRNYTTLLEAELAVLQDLGYNIDRRNFFGSSVYGDGLTLVNDNGYFGRNAAGTAYVNNTYNQALVGLGLHVYGNNNNITQRADLLSAGAGGGGIRVDGQGNTITILPGTRVHANGAYARGVMFAYGKDHQFVQRGDVEALGSNGIAASFDFGSNASGNQQNYRGSYFHLVDGQPGPLLPELDGPLVKQFDLTGRLAGQYASIYMADNAYVEQINIMHGASLTGDIYSFYKEKDALGAQRLTALKFGLTPDANGQATNYADANFALRYNGNITGIDNLSLQLLGGSTEINGTHALYAANIAQGASLSGNSLYRLNTAGTFTNAGTLAVNANGNTTITGDYIQSATGTLQAGISGDNTLHNLVVNGNATISGTLTIAPQRSWFANGAQFSSDKWIDATSLTGVFTDLAIALDSPTLTAAATDLGNHTYSLTVSRLANAYSSQANTDSGRQIGVALDAIASNASKNMQPLFAALDFSATNGGQIRSAFTQLSPATYAEMFHGSLLRERHISQLVAGAVQNSVSTGWQSFAIPFGGYYRHSANGNATGSNGNMYGVVFGGEANYQDWALGVHGAVSGQSTRVGGEAAASGKSAALDLGTHLRFASNPYQGAHAFALARLGVDDTQFDRTVNINGYTAKPSSKWTGVTATTGIGGGWRFQMGEASSIGPITGLDYTVLHRPDVTESGGAGANLHLDKKTFSSLRAHVGGEWQSRIETTSGKTFNTSLQAAWHHELRDTTVHHTANFAGYSANSFGEMNSVAAKDSVSVQAGLSYQLKEAMQLKAALSTTMWKGGDAEFAGAVSVNWRF